jgi:hypothetical protein
MGDLICATSAGERRGGAEPAKVQIQEFSRWFGCWRIRPESGSWKKSRPAFTVA